MSFKGFQKAVARAPQTLRQKFNMGEQTKDPVYEDAESRFKELEAQTKRLNTESKRYHKAVDDMLQHQIGFAQAIKEVYKPITGLSQVDNAEAPEGNPEGIEACEQYGELMGELKETLKPDLDLIDTKIVQPAQELLKIIQAIRKMSVKRAHKQLDLDRFQNSLTKFQEKRDKASKKDETKALKYEEKIYKAENDVAIAQQEYDYYNEMMKNELPELFKMQAEFIQPLFISLYYMQLNVFYTLSSRMEEMKIPYFDLSSDILESFQRKRGNIEEQADAISITHFKLSYSRSKLDATKKRLAMEHGSPYGEPGASGAPPAYGTQAAASPYGQASAGAPVYGQASAGAPAYGQQTATPAYGQAPAYGQTPAYGQQAVQTPPSSTAGNYGYPADVKNPAGPGAVPAAAASAPAYTATAPAYTAATPAYTAATPPASSAATGQELCTALYDYTAQAAGDLSFKTGDKIVIIDRTAGQNGWWTGSHNGATGVFPSNYVQLI